MGAWNPTSIWMPGGVGYISQQNPGFALPSPTVQSSIPPQQSQDQIPGMPQSPYLSGVTNTAPNPATPGQTITSPTNPLQFATPEAAQAIAAYLGGNVSQSQLSGPGNSWSTPQAMINVPGSPNPLNAGLAAQNYGNYGASPTGYGSYKISQDLGKTPSTETAAQFALSNPNFQMNPTLGNSGPGYNYVYNPTTGKYVNNVSGTADVGGANLSQADAIAQMRKFNGVGPGGVPMQAGTPPPAGSPPPAGGSPPSPLTVGSRAIPPTTIPPAGPGASSPPNPSWVPPGYSINPGTGMLQRASALDRSGPQSLFGNRPGIGQQPSTIDTTDLTVQPDINGAYTGSVSVGGQPQTIAITPDGRVFDSGGNDITSRFGPNDLSSLYSSFGQASGNQDYGSQLSQASTVLNTGPTGVTPPHSGYTPPLPTDGSGTPPVGPVGAQPPGGPSNPPGPGGPTPPNPYVPPPPGGPSNPSNPYVPPPPPSPGGPNPSLINPPAGPGSGIPPNSNNPFSGTGLGSGNPYNYLGQGYTDANGNYVPPSLAGGIPGMGNYAGYSGGSPFATGLDEQATNNRNITLSQGQSLDQSLQNYINYQSGQDMMNQGELNSAYTPIASGQGGYSQAQKDAILNQPYLNSLQITPGQEQSNYLSSGEQAGIAGNPQGVMQQLGSDEGAMNQNINSNVGSINSDLATQTGNVNNTTANTGGNVRGAVGQEVSNISNTLSATNPAVNNAIRQTASNTNAYLDPTALNASADYMQNENVSPQDVQNILNQAGSQVGNQELSDENRILQEANAQGNVSPLALSAARDRLRQQSAVGESQAMTDAAIKAKNLQLGTTQARENTRLGAAQSFAGLGTNTQLAEGNQNVAGQEYLGNLGLQGAATEGAAQIGAEQYLGTQAQQAQQYLGTSALNNQQQLNQQQQQNLQYQTSQNVSAGQTADQAASARAATIAANRQATNAYNQGQELQRGQYIYGQDSTANTNFANEQLKQEQEYRNYLQNQQAQSNQNVSVGNQQRLGAYGTQTGGINQATSVGVTNYGTKPGDPTTATNLINSTGVINSGRGTGNAKGGISQGPHMALVGEAGPELIVDLAPKMAARGDTASPSENPMYLKILAQMLGLGGGSGTTWGMDIPPSYASSYTQLNNYGGLNPGSTPPAATLPGGSYPGEPPVSQGGGYTPGNYPLTGWSYYPPSGPTGPIGTSSSTITYGDMVGGGGPGDNSGDNFEVEDKSGEVVEPYLSGKKPKDTYGVSSHAGGGIGEPPQMKHFYGPKSKLHKDLEGAPNVSLVTKPTVMMLGAKVPQAVVPITQRKSNKVTPQMIPHLMRKYGNYGSGVPI